MKFSQEVRWPCTTCRAHAQRAFCLLGCGAKRRKDAGMIHATADGRAQGAPNNTRSQESVLDFQISGGRVGGFRVRVLAGGRE